MSLKKIVGIGTASFSALTDAESKLPYPINESLKYKELKVYGPTPIEGVSSNNFRVEIEYELEELPHRRPLDASLFEKDSDPFLRREDVKKMIAESVDAAVQKYFKDWMSKK